MCYVSTEDTAGGLKVGVQRRSRDADHPTTLREIYQRHSRNLR
ncbi:hypothetical protein [Nostoc sp. LEGE 12447]|nr:hypothetical protein [Nostoc sp. LEGE 12447]